MVKNYITNKIKSEFGQRLLIKFNIKYCDIVKKFYKLPRITSKANF